MFSLWESIKKTKKQQLKTIKKSKNGLTGILAYYETAPRIPDGYEVDDYWVF